MQDSSEIRQFLRNLAATANNIILKGEFSGEDMIQAVKFLDTCQKVVKTIDEIKNEPK